jgi:hypothetical protein
LPKRPGQKPSWVKSASDSPDGDPNTGIFVGPIKINGIVATDDDG